MRRRLPQDRAVRGWFRAKCFQARFMKMTFNFSSISA